MEWKSPIQEPVIVLDYIGNIANGAFIETQDVEELNPLLRGIPCVGMMQIYGSVFSTQNVTVDISQGVADTAGTLIYDVPPVNFAVLAGTGVPRIVPIVGKFVKVRVSNASGFVANVRTFFVVRAYA